jgi:polyphosphate glucokinase
MRVLAIDVGGTHVKVKMRDTEEVKADSGPEMTSSRMADTVMAMTKDWQYDYVSIGYPGPVVHEKIVEEPHNLAPGWVGYDFARHFGKPVRITNDAAMQALGSYEGGRMLFLGLGTGLGSAMILDKVLAPMELAHLPYHKDRTYEDYLGLRGLKKYGKKRWRKAVFDVVARFKAAFVVDYIVLGGGNVRKLDELPDGARRGNNTHAFIGGYRLWEGVS